MDQEVWAYGNEQEWRPETEEEKKEELARVMYRDRKVRPSDWNKDGWAKSKGSKKKESDFYGFSKKERKAREDYITNLIEEMDEDDINYKLEDYDVPYGSYEDEYDDGDAAYERARDDGTLDSFRESWKANGTKLM
tara:strand:- start:1140 stop:1547 length:408 start_codon:yes stop_codon:yes gene_type:complete